MPAIAKVTKEMIIEAAFEVAKEMGGRKHNRPDSFAKTWLFNAARFILF